MVASKLSISFFLGGLLGNDFVLCVCSFVDGGSGMRSWCLMTYVTGLNMMIEWWMSVDWLNDFDSWKQALRGGESGMCDDWGSADVFWTQGEGGMSVGGISIVLEYVRNELYSVWVNLLCCV